MCGIIGYTGQNESSGKIIAGLQALAYRGYDSAGIAAFSEDGIQVVKTAGKVSVLEAELDARGGIVSTCAIGHTRWATHGAPTANNAHPHQVGAVTLVHNGIIENEAELRKEYLAQGRTFRSETDTEVAAMVIDQCYRQEKDPVKALRKSEEILRGAYAFAVLFEDLPGNIYALRRQSPLLIAPAEDGIYLASDLPAVLPYTKRRFLLDEGEVAVLTKENVTVYGGDGEIVEKELETFDLDMNAAEKGGWPHFMLKEIHEQPEALRRTILPRVREGMPYLEADGISDELLKNLTSLRVVACGTAMHAGIVGKTMIESLARVPVTVEIASEFRYCDPILRPDEPVLCVSQSGETADTLAALRMAKAQKIPTIGIVNVKGSALSREADAVFYTHAGPEIAVASTKAYTVQLSAFALLAIRMAYARGTITEEQTRSITAFLAEDVPAKLEETLVNSDACVRFARHLEDQEHAFFLGRGVDYTLSMEASLKLKEISYIHSEAYAAGELKHGTISLITDGTPVIVTASDPRLFEKTVGSLREAASRGGKILLLASPALGTVDSAVDTIVLPDMPSFFAPFASITYLQRIAYETAVLLGRDVDQPRNLAKSVTVE